MDDVGLGVFSLDLHGRNQTITAVRTQLQTAIEHGADRSPAWESLLRYHFEHVTVVHAADYRPGMSDDADVTIFDARPPEREGAGRDIGSYHQAGYLPHDFDRPALLIAENSARIGEPLGLKLDWM